ncbi:hypothetical protein ACFSGX_06640 [Sphingomonas arantia]|uniref:Uncharacterized protein n=1 Tax=Sphingomonas arantia TaxID=1460676 RepID=A0ABW4TXI5_9SPHN
MNLRDLFRSAPKTAAPVDTPRLTVRVNGRTVATVHTTDIPCDLHPDVALDAPATIEFVDDAGTVHRHHLPADSGWLHLSVRVHPNLGCQADAVVTARPDHASGAAIADDEVAMRFQPFFLPGATAPTLTGRGLFARGLHFAGLVTPGNILLSCECDACGRSFVVRSFHAGFADLGYFYSASGRHTLTVAASLPGAPVALADPDPTALAALEASLPAAPDGTAFAYRNPFRCPHCAAPYVDFTSHPEQRAGEYYGLYFPETPPIRFAPPTR